MRRSVKCDRPIGSRCKKIVFLALCLFGIAALRAQQKEPSSLRYWSEKKPLDFDDFGTNRKSGDTIFIHLGKGAGVHRLGSIRTAIDVQVQTEKKHTLFTIRAVMDKKGSWIRDTEDTVTLLHERGHFDICEIYTRIMRREMGKATSLAQSKTLYEKVLAQEAAEQLLFDQENTFEQGGITTTWRRKIKNRLQQLQRFSNPKLILATGK